MDFPSYTRYVDALLLLSLKIGEISGEQVVTSPSCVSSTILTALHDMGYLEFGKMSGNYVITAKGQQVLDQVKHAPWGIIDINMSPPVVQV